MCYGQGCIFEDNNGVCIYSGNSIPTTASCHPNFEPPIEECPNCGTCNNEWNIEEQTCDCCGYPNHEIIDDTEELFNLDC